MAAGTQDRVASVPCAATGALRPDKGALSDDASRGGCFFAVFLLFVCSSSALRLLFVCSLSVLRLLFLSALRLLFVCSSSVLCLFFVCSLSVLCLLFVCSLSVLCLFFVCSLSVLCLFFVCSLSVLCLFFVCSLSVLCLYRARRHGGIAAVFPASDLARRSLSSAVRQHGGQARHSAALSVSSL